MSAVGIGLALVTFVIGGLMARTTLCNVACMHELVVGRRLDGMLRIAVVVGWSGVTLLSLALWAPMAVALPVDPPLMLPAVLGGVLLGLGACVNGACFLGTVGYLTRGQIGFLFTGIGLLLALRFGVAPMRVVEAPQLRIAMTHLAQLGLGMFAVLLALAAACAVRAARAAVSGRQRRLVRSLLVAAAVGVLAGFIYAGHPNWNYASVLSAVAHVGRQRVDWPAQVAAIALLIGAVVSAASGGQWHFQRPTLARAARSLAGGALMGAGALLVPGGHDLLLLWSVPGLERAGAAAYVAMTLTVAALLWGELRLRRYLSGRSIERSR